MDMFNTDSGLRPPSPPSFSGPSQGLFDDPLGSYGAFRLAESTDYLGLPPPPPPPPPFGMVAPTPPSSTMSNSSSSSSNSSNSSLSSLAFPDPSLSLFNPSEQKYFSEFLDTLVIDQDFTFDPTAFPNLPSLNLFSQGSAVAMAGPGPGPGPGPGQNLLPFPPGMDSGAGGHDRGRPLDYPSYSMPDARAEGASQKSGTRTSVQTQTSIVKTEMPEPSLLSPETGTAPSKLVTPTRQLSKLTLENRRNQVSAAAAAAGSNSVVVAAGSRHSKKTKREGDEQPSYRGQGTSSQQYASRASPALSSDGSSSAQGSSTKAGADSHLKHVSQHRRQSSRERNASVSDEYGSDSATTSISAAAAAAAASAKRKPFKELLTEEEKRANHIASEQKRRNTIRNGFKDMTEIIPELRDVNSSKSTILFKAVDFIRLLERKNRALQDKAAVLESRLQMQHMHPHSHPQQQQQHSRPSQPQPPPPAAAAPPPQPQHPSSYGYPSAQYSSSHGQYSSQLAPPMPPSSSHHAHHAQQQHRHHQQQQQQQQHPHPSHLLHSVQDRLQDIPHIYPVSAAR